MVIKIAIIGKMCSGKSTLANKLIKYYKRFGIKLEKRAFANKVYELAKDLFNMKEKNRLLLQKIGTKMREIDNDVWINYTLKNLPKNVIIEDCRYINELQHLINNGFTIIKINISKKKQLKRLKKTYSQTWKSHIANLNHESETSLDNISNDSIHYIINY
jgi:dephospho-CoA kinase